MISTTLALQLLTAAPRYGMSTEVEGGITASHASIGADALGGGGAAAMSFHLRPVIDNSSPRSRQVWLQRTPTVTVFVGGERLVYDLPGVDLSEGRIALGATLRYDTRGLFYLRASGALSVDWGSLSLRGAAPPAGVPDGPVSWRSWGMDLRLGVGLRVERFEVELGALVARPDLGESASLAPPTPGPWGGYATARALLGRWVNLEGGLQYLAATVTLWVEPGLLVGRDFDVRLSAAWLLRGITEGAPSAGDAARVGVGVGYWLGAVQLHARYELQWGDLRALPVLLSGEVDRSHLVRFGVTWRSR